MRMHILSTIVQAPELVRSQLGLVIRFMVDDDFPSKWPGFDQELLSYLSSPQYAIMFGALVAMYEIAKKFQFKDTDERVAYDALLSIVLPKLHEIVDSLASTPTPDNILATKIVFKIVYRSIEVRQLS